MVINIFSQVFHFDSTINKSTSMHLSLLNYLFECRYESFFIAEYSTVRS